MVQGSVASPFRRILACVALAPHLPALVREAAALARLSGAELAFIHAGEDREGIERAVRAALPPEGVAEPAITVRRGGTERVILDEARRWNADLIFAGALGSDPFLTGVVGSLARRLARHADRSVYLSLHPLGGAPAWRSLVVAVEFDAGSRAAAGIAVGLARRADAESVHFVHEYDPRAMGASESVVGGDRQAVYEQTFSGARRFQLADLVESLDLGGLSSKLACLEGRDLVQTASYARNVRADLLVLAPPPRRIGFLERLLGEPTETVLQRFPCSLLLVRPPGPRREWTPEG